MKSVLIQPLCEEEYSELYYKELYGRASKAEKERLAHQRELDRKKFPFFNVLLSKRNVQILHKMENNDTVVVRGGNRSTKTTMDCFWVNCMSSGYWPVGYKEYWTVDKMPVYKPIMKQYPDRMYIPRQCVAWISCLDKNTQIAPRGMQDTIMAMLPVTWIKSIKRNNRIYLHTIELKNGSIIQFKSTESGVDTYQSASLDVVVMDELHPETIWDEIRSRVHVRIPKTLFTYFPRAGKDWTFKRFVERKTDDKSDVVVNETLSFLDNPFIPDSIKAAQMKRWENDPMKVARITGAYTDFSGMVYPSFRGFEEFNKGLPSHVFDPMKTAEFIENGGKPPSSWTQFVAIDTHNSEKGCSTIWCAVAPNTRRYYWQEYQESGSSKKWGRDIKAMDGEYEIETHKVDPSANTNDANGFNIAEELEDGIGQPVEWANRDHAAGILAVTAGLDILTDDEGNEVDGLPGIMISKFCPIAINQMSSYTNKSARLGDVKKVDDEMVDNIRYIEVDKPADYAPVEEPSECSEALAEAAREREIQYA